MKPKTAVVGSGIAGLASAWLLRDRYDVRVYEQNTRAGGHSNTVTIDTAEGPRDVDTGFIVYNEPNYPHLTALFAHLGIGTRTSDMSFGASIDGGAVEYAGSDLGSLFAQRRNLVSIQHMRMLRDILRFNRQAKALLRDGVDTGLSVGQFLDANGYSRELRDRYLLPMAAAIWSAPVRQMLAFPLLSFARFYDNHGLLSLMDRPQWRTVVGGSRRYVDRLTRDLDGRVSVNTPVVGVRRLEQGVVLRLANGAVRHFDRVIMAGHADQSLRLLEDPTPGERALLSRFRYQPNRAVLHSDARLMPRNRKVWSSWNYLSRGAEPLSDGAVSVTYWMNRLQRLDTASDYFVSLNPIVEPGRRSVIAEFDYEHPVFDHQAMAVQGRLGNLQGVNKTWFCGSYFGYGFHEDALRSAVDVAEALGVHPPWATGRRSAGLEFDVPDRESASSRGI